MDNTIKVRENRRNIGHRKRTNKTKVNTENKKERLRGSHQNRDELRSYTDPTNKHG